MYFFSSIQSECITGLFFTKRYSYRMVHNHIFLCTFVLICLLLFLEARWSDGLPSDSLIKTFLFLIRNLFFISKFSLCFFFSYFWTIYVHLCIFYLCLFGILKILRFLFVIIITIIINLLLNINSKSTCMNTVFTVYFTPPKIDITHRVVIIP